MSMYVTLHLIDGSKIHFCDWDKENERTSWNTSVTKDIAENKVRKYWISKKEPFTVNGQMIKENEIKNGTYLINPQHIVSVEI